MNYLYIAIQCIIRIHTHIIGHRNPSVRIIDLVSHTTHVVYVNFIHKWRNLQFKVNFERQIFWETLVFSFLPKNVNFILKNPTICLFLKNVSPSKRAICFILNNLHIPMVEGIAFYALYKSRVLIIPCKADDSCLFIGLPDQIYKKVPGLFCGVTLRKHYIIKATWSATKKIAFTVRTVLKRFFWLKKVLKKWSREISDLATLFYKW